MRTRSIFARLSLLSLVLGLLAGASPVLAQDAQGVFPQLDGHRFSPTNIVPDPWVRSYVASTLGLGQAYGIESRPIVIDGDTIPGLSGDLMFAALDLKYQQKIVDWFAFRVGYRVDARLGTDVETLLSRGVNTITGFEIGWLARLLESHNNMLSLDVRVSNKNYTTVDLYKFVEDVIEGVDPALVRTGPAMRAAVGVRYAHVFSNLFGIIANGEVGSAEDVARTGGDEFFYRFGGQLDFDLAAWRGIPVNLALGFRTDSYPEAPSDEVGSLNSGFVRVSYIARDDFTIGLSVGGSNVPLAGERDNMNYGTLEFDLRYYF
jgi:hypothetical protein